MSSHGTAAAVDFPVGGRRDRRRIPSDASGAAE